MIAVRSGNSTIVHLAYERANTTNDSKAKTVCKRQLTWPVEDRDGMHWDEMHKWPVQYKLCPKCGNLTNFMSASRERWEERQKIDEARVAAYKTAKALSAQKEAILENEVWPDVIKALEDIGWKINQLEYPQSGHIAILEHDKFTFKLNLNKPLTTFGVLLGTWEIREHGN